MKLHTQVAKGLKWQAINTIGRQLLSLLVFTTLARLLDPAAFGLMGLVSVYLGFVGMFADQGIGAALIQRKELSKEHLDTAFWLNAASAAILCVATIAFAAPVSEIFGTRSLAQLLRVASLTFLLNSASAIHATLFTRDMDFRRPVIRTLLANLTGGVIGITMALCGLGVWSLIGQQLSAALAGALFLWAVSPYRPHLTFSLPHFKELLGVSASVFASGFLWFIALRTDQLVIGKFAGASALGIYVIATKLPEITKLITLTPVAEVSLPTLSRLQSDYDRLRSAVYKGMELNALLAFPAFVGIAIVATTLVPLVFGAQWRAAAPLCSLLSLNTLITTLVVFIHPCLLASGGAGRYVIVNICQTAGVAAACLIGIHFGLIQVVAGLIINGIVMAFIALFFLRKRIGLSILEYCRPCLLPAAASAIMAGGVYAVRSMWPGDAGSTVELFVEILAGALVYIAIIFQFKRSSIDKLISTAKRAFAPESKAAESPSA